MSTSVVSTKLYSADNTAYAKGGRPEGVAFCPTNAPALQSNLMSSGEFYSMAKNRIGQLGTPKPA